MQYPGMPQPADFQPQHPTKSVMTPEQVRPHSGGNRRKTNPVSVTRRALPVFFATAAGNKSGAGAL
jgi:hypothetical protein